MHRDPRWGRNEESYSEDPYLVSRIAETIVRAVQGRGVPLAEQRRPALRRAPAIGTVHREVRIFARAVAEGDLVYRFADQRHDWLVNHRRRITVLGEGGSYGGTIKLHSDIRSDPWRLAIVMNQNNSRGQVHINGIGRWRLGDHHFIFHLVAILRLWSSQWSDQCLI